MVLNERLRCLRLAEDVLATRIGSRNCSDAFNLFQAISTERTKVEQGAREVGGKGARRLECKIILKLSDLRTSNRARYLTFPVSMSS